MEGQRGDGPDRREVLEGLLQRLGLGAEDLSRSLPNRAKAAIQELDPEGDDASQLEALQALCEALSFGSEESAVLMSPRRVAPALAELMRRDGNPDVALMATRAVAQLAEANPTAGSRLLEHGTVETLCERLTNIEYIDLAEESLQCLEKLSEDHAKELFARGAVESALSFVDFFTEGAQRGAAMLAKKVCREASSRHKERAIAICHMVAPLLSRDDAQIAENACDALANLTCAVHQSDLPRMLDAGAVSRAIELASRSKQPENGLAIAAYSANEVEGAKNAAREAGADALVTNVLKDAGRRSHAALSRALDLGLHLSAEGDRHMHDAALELAAGEETTEHLRVQAIEVARRAGADRLKACAGLGGRMARLIEGQARHGEVQAKAIQLALELAQSDVGTAEEFKREGVATRAEELAANGVGAAQQLVDILATVGPGMERIALRKANEAGPEAALSELEKAEATGHEVLESGVLETVVNAAVNKQMKGGFAPGQGAVRSAIRALESAERLVASKQSNDGPRRGHGMERLGRPVKISLEKDASQNELRDLYGRSIAVEPLATISTLAGFIRTRARARSSRDSIDDDDEDDGSHGDEENDDEEDDDDEEAGDIEEDSHGVREDEEEDEEDDNDEHHVDAMDEDEVGDQTRLEEHDDEEDEDDDDDDNDDDEVDESHAEGESEEEGDLDEDDEEENEGMEEEFGFHEGLSQIGNDVEVSIVREGGEESMPLPHNVTLLEAALAYRPDKSPWDSPQPLTFRYKLERGNQPRKHHLPSRKAQGQKLPVEQVFRGEGAATAINQAARPPLAFLCLGRQVAATGITSVSEWVSQALSAKLWHLVSDPLLLAARPLPEWASFLLTQAPFLFPLRLRRLVFLGTSFPLQRSLFRLHQQQLSSRGDNPEEAGRRGNDPLDRRASRLRRYKAILPRGDRFLHAAMNALRSQSSSSSVLEVKFEGEAGSGTGPTFEFYTLVGKELQRRDLRLWRTLPENEDAKGDERRHVNAPGGLFPIPVQPGETLSESGHKLYRTAGRAVGKAVADGRVLDLPLATAVWRFIRGEEIGIADLEPVEPELVAGLRAVQERAVQGGVDELGLRFAVPSGDGDVNSEIELIPGGRNQRVSAERAIEFVREAQEAIVGRGVEEQLKEIRTGVEEVMRPEEFGLFDDGELGWLLRGEGPDALQWTKKELSSQMGFDHGYTSTSRHAQMFLEIVSEMENEDRRRLLRFVTGSERLPPGGLGSLQPKLTVVKKQPTGVGEGLDEGTAADADLPSAMTCQNFLKLPPHSSKEAMETRLLYAIRECQSSFQLS